MKNTLKDFTKTISYRSLAGTVDWSDYANSDPIEDIRKSFKSLKEYQEAKHWNREGLREAYKEIGDAMRYYLDNDDMESYLILDRCRMSMEFNGLPVSHTKVKKGQKLLSKYRLTARPTKEVPTITN